MNRARLKLTNNIKGQHFLLGLGGILVFLAAWDVISRFNLINPIFISSPENVFKVCFELFSTRMIYPHLIVSLEEIFIGVFLSIFFGVALGMILGWYEKINLVSSPLIYALYSTPIIAIFPLILIWLGFGIWSKVVIIFLAGFFPIIINTTNAVKNLDPDLLRLGKSFGASDFDIFRKITLPSSIPFIMSGLRIAIPRCIMGMVVGEFFASNEGLGYLITFYGATFQTSRLLAVVLIIVTISIILTLIIDHLEKRTQTWRPKKTY